MISIQDLVYKSFILNMIQSSLKPQDQVFNTLLIREAELGVINCNF